ncbi:nucleoporin NUP42-like [Chrysoperla carnea]|uniref:nucleoporin NUP42-like n=1 Tax=Chrysoperla carnea TaxID=189513 RepID=UPI001D064AB8|nr:nucleoporin NUP42-like [Chrysoperla carnea]XP_044739576.1 nucleoporin NUP42-like [Chrysoperla carnea]
MSVKTIIFTVATLCVAVWSYPMNFEYAMEPDSYYEESPYELTQENASPLDDISSLTHPLKHLQELSRNRRSPFGAFGSRNNFPTGGFSQTAGFGQGPFSASVSQDFNHRGIGGPQTFNTGANFANPNTGSGVNFGLSKTPSFGGSATAGGSINLHHTPNGNLNAVGQHTQHYDKDWNRVGQSNFAGLQFQNKDTSVGVGATRIEPVFGKGETQYGLNVEKKF